MGHRKIAGLSKSSISHSSRNRTRRSTILQSASQAERRHQSSIRRSEVIQGLSYEDRENVATMEAMDIDSGTWRADGNIEPLLFSTAPPGDEGFGISHEGGEHEAFEGLVEDLSKLTFIHRLDDRDRRNRIEVRNNHWEQQMDQLVEAYLEYGMHDDGELRSAPPLPPEVLGSIDIEVIDEFYRGHRSFLAGSTDIWPNITLVRNGYLGSAPLGPTVAISIRTLVGYQQAHRVCPRLSIQAEVKKLCHIHKVPFRRYLAEQFSIAYDVYLEILDRVDKQIKVALGRDGPNSRLYNSCPPCFYVLQDEPDLKYKFFCEMDGGNSCKRTKAILRHQIERSDTRGPRSDRWILPDEVDRFAKARKATAAPDEDVSGHDLWEDIPAEDPVRVCIERWKNAGPEERKRMWDMFDECGIFVVVCRHGSVMWICDMIRSGELAKYPLAMINKILDVFKSWGVACGYDIACAFWKTLMDSILGEKARGERFRMVVGSFHGHAHNRGCQVNWHPLYVKRMGRANFEGCERFFNLSNPVAPGTRHASKFHRWQAIDEHIAFWDEDKYAALSSFMYNHYREALEVVHTCSNDLRSIQERLGIAEADFERYLSCEKEYLEGLKHEPPSESLKLRYVEALQQLAKARAEYNDLLLAGKALSNKPAGPNIWVELVNADKLCNSAMTKVHDIERRVVLLENQLQIPKRWDFDSAEYKNEEAYMGERRYRRALDELERLVVQRLFELSKLNISGTGYKLRTRIAKALQTRSEAIRRALGRYNTEAANLVPPREQLTWKQVVEYSFLAEFDVLRYSRTDIREEKWTQPAHREATIKYLQLQRAKEEIERLNVEIRRLRTYMHDETKLVVRVIDELSSSGSALVGEMRRRWGLRSMINAIHAHRLARIESLPGFTGTREIGVLDSSKLVQEILVPELQQTHIIDEEEISQDLDGVASFVEGIVD